MQNPWIAVIFAAAALILSAAACATAAAAESRTPIFAADREACFGRVYDAAHLKSHPRQRVTSIHVMRSLERRREAENWSPEDREEEIRSFRRDGRTSVTAFVNFRDRKNTFYNSLTCENAGRPDMTCLIECDGGSFRLARSGPNSVLLHNNGFILVGGCGEDVPEEKMVHFSPGADDKVFRLDSRPIAACRAEEQKAVPIRTGAPLRERFKEDEQFCFGRDYDAAHLNTHPKQEVAQIRVGRLSPATERGDSPYKWWWFNVKLEVSVTMKSNLRTTTTRYSCGPTEASWECFRIVEGENTACNERSIHLVRGPSDDILVYNRRSGLPLDRECETAKTDQAESQRPSTRSDDRVFRLTRMPIRQCQL